MRRRLVGVVVAVVAVAIALWWWQRGDDTAGSGTTVTTSGRTGFDPAHPVLPKRGWLGQRGVGERDVAGIVVGDRGPVAGATVRFTSYTAPGIQQVTTGADGTFDLGPQLARRYVIGADAPGFAPAAMTVDTIDPHADPGHLELVMHPCEAWVHGTVRDGGGGTIAHALVGVSTEPETARGSETDDQGAFDVCVPVGPVVISARAEGYATVRDAVTATGKIRHDFTLGPEAIIVGHVVRRGDHAEVAGANVGLQLPSGITYATADDHGRFTFDALAPGRYAVTATADQLATAKPVEITAEVGSSHDEILEVVPTYAVVGKVVETGTQTGIAGIAIRIFTRTGIETRPLTATSQSDGSFEIALVAPGTYGVVVAEREPAKTDPANISIEAADANVVFHVDRTASISGRVTRAGKPVDGVPVAAYEHSAITDSAGRFSLRDIRAGTYTLYAESSRLGAFTTGPKVTVAAGEDKKGVEIELDLAGQISGKLVDQNGKPVPAAVINFSLIQGRDYGIATTQDDGSFIARGLSGGGDYVYSVSAAGTDGITYPPASGRAKPIRVADGSSRADGVEIRVRVERLTIAGHVTDDKSAPLADVMVRATSSRGYGSAPVRTDPGGGFELVDLPAGIYSLTATSADGETWMPKVEAGRRDVTLAIAAAGSLEGTLAGFTEPVEVLAFDARSRRPLSVTTTDSTFRFPHLAAGRYELVAHTRTDGGVERIDVTSGAPTKVAIHARGFASVSGALRDRATNQPIAGAHCSAESPDTSFLYYLADYKRPTDSITDASGTYALDHVVAGEVSVWCYAESLYAGGSVNAKPGDSAHLDILARAVQHDPVWNAGIAVEDRFGEAYVSRVVKDGPGDRAGVRAGDRVTKIGMQSMDHTDGYEISMRLAELSTSPVAITVMRDDKELTLSLATTP